MFDEAIVMSARMAVGARTRAAATTLAGLGAARAVHAASGSRVGEKARHGIERQDGVMVTQNKSAARGGAPVPFSIYPQYRNDRCR
ncbi:hypothetical protein SAMN04487769_3337 [Burkholderia sp. b14]|nr:hypothetical protein SAMN04487769_3337 [Burkholderia sp. b14]